MNLQLLLANIGGRLVVAAVVLLIGFVFARIIGKMVSKLLHELELNGIYRAMTGSKISLEGAVSTFIVYLLYFVVVVIALDQLGINTLVFDLIAAGVIIMVFVSIALSVKDFMPNLVAGFMLGKRRSLKVNDRISVKNMTGKVVHIGLLETRVRTLGGDELFVPNSTLIKEAFVKKK